MKTSIKQMLNKPIFRIKRILKKVFFHEANRLVIWFFILYALLAFAALMGVKSPFGYELNNDSARVEIFSVGIGSLASILGIVIAFLIATVEMNRRYLTSKYVIDLFNNDTLRGLIVLYLGTIVLSMAGLLSINFNNISLTTNLALVSIYLFIISIIALIPRMKRLVSDTNIDKEIKKLIKSMTSRARPGFYAVSEDDAQLLVEIAKKALSEGEESIVIQILQELRESFNRVSEHVGESSDGIIYNAQPRDMARTFSWIFFAVANSALENRQLNIAAYACDCILNIMRTYVQKQQRYHTLIDVTDDLMALLKKSIRIGSKELVSRLVYGFQDYLEYQLRHNSPPATELWEFDAFDKNRDVDKIDYNLSNHWRHIAIESLYKFKEIGTWAIQYKSLDTLRSILSALENHIDAIKSMEEISEEHKYRSLKPTYHFLEGIYREMISSNLFTKKDYLGLRLGYDLDKDIKHGENYAVWGIQTLCKISMFAVENDKLEPHELNDIGVGGRSVAGNIKQYDLAAKATIYIIETLSRIKDVVAERVKDDEWAAEIYEACYNQTISIRDWQRKEKVKVAKVTRRINKALAEYEFLDSAKNVSRRTSSDLWTGLFGES